MSTRNLARAGLVAAVATTLGGAVALSAVAAPTDPLAPTAVNDSFNVQQDRTAIVGAPGVLSNDFGPSEPLHVFKPGRAKRGRLTMNIDGSFAYTPHPGFAGEDTVTYQAAIGSHRSNEAKILFTVKPSALTGSTPLVVVGEDGTFHQDDLGATLNIAVFDQDTPFSSIKLTATSSNQTLVPTANVTFTGNATSRRVSINTVADKSGTAVVSLKVTDGKNSSNTPITVKVGGSGAETITGTAGADLLLGGAGDDKLDGKGGNDVLMGGTGKDLLTGGTGADHFLNDGVDGVTDFHSVEGDLSGV